MIAVSDARAGPLEYTSTYTYARTSIRIHEGILTYTTNKYIKHKHKHSQHEQNRSLSRAHGHKQTDPNPACDPLHLLAAAAAVWLPRLGLAGTGTSCWLYGLILTPGLVRWLVGYTLICSRTASAVPSRRLVQVPFAIASSSMSDLGELSLFHNYCH